MPSPATTADRARQIVVTVSEVACVLGTMAGVGVFGGPAVADAAGGALAADATLLAPATPAFAIWTPIYLGLAAYTVWQWLPGQATDARHRSIGYLAAASMLLNAGWLLVIQQGWLWLSVVAMGALVTVLGLLVLRLERRPSYGAVEAVVVDGTFGAYLGWVSVAAIANVTATLVDRVGDPPAPWPVLLAVLALVVAAALGIMYARRLGARWAIAGALAWGLAWAGWARLTGEPASAFVGLAAVAVAVVVLAAAARQRPRLAD